MDFNLDRGLKLIMWMLYVSKVLSGYRMNLISLLFLLLCFLEIGLIAIRLEKYMELINQKYFRRFKNG